MSKKCGRCQIEKDVAEFGKNKSRADGLVQYCKSCVKQIQHDKRKEFFLHGEKDAEVTHKECSDCKKMCQKETDI